MENEKRIAFEIDKNANIILETIDLKTITLTGYYNGHLVEYIDDEWVYSDTKESSKNNSRPCVECGKYPTKEGHDACISNLPGVKYACCGHGVSEGYLQFEDDRVLRFNNLEFK